MSRLSKAVRLILAVLQEIFDESSYARFLTRARVASSPQAYAAFLSERESACARRIKCC